MNKARNKMVFFVVIVLLFMLSFSVYAFDLCELAQSKILAIYFGYELRHNAYCRYPEKVGYISENGYKTINTTFIRGNTYFIIGVGDEGVNDLDIILYDEDEIEIDRDTQTNEVPIIKFTPRWSGKFKISVKMNKGSGCAYLGICYL